MAKKILRVEPGVALGMAKQGKVTTTKKKKIKGVRQPGIAAPNYSEPSIS